MEKRCKVCGGKFDARGKAKVCIYCRIKADYNVYDLCNEFDRRDYYKYRDAFNMVWRD